MKLLPAELAAHLASGATTLAWCWRLTRRDGRQLGFTDHDRDLHVDGTVFQGRAGLTASDMKQSVGLGVDDLEVEGALTSEWIAEKDVMAGLFDDARVEVFRVNWAAPEQHVLVRVGSLGEVRRAGASFVAEVRGLAHYAQQPRGRLYQYTCDADLGDRRCGVDLDRGDLRSARVVMRIVDRFELAVSGAGQDPIGWLARGLLDVTTGAATGFRVEIRTHTERDGTVVLTTWQAVPNTLAAGDAIRVTAGCDKQIATCVAKFQNAAAFRGFPHMPGNDYLSRVAVPGDVPHTA